MKGAPWRDRKPGRGAKPNGREAQRRQTRQRVYAAAIAEFKRAGMADADVGVIVKEAGVARGTFYFHYPTKEHVLAELERHRGNPGSRPARRGSWPGPMTWRRSSARLSGCSRRSSAGSAGCSSTRCSGCTSRRGGPDVLPGADQWTEYPLMTLVVEAVQRARERGEVYPDANALHTAQFFMLGLYAMLITSHGQPRGGTGRDPRQLRRHRAARHRVPLSRAGPTVPV